MFTCRTCFKLFNSMKLLITHQNIIHRKVKCRKCGLILNNRPEIQIHHLMQHAGAENLQEIPWDEESSPIGDDVMLTKEYNLKKAIY